MKKIIIYLIIIFSLILFYIASIHLNINLKQGDIVLNLSEEYNEPGFKGCIKDIFGFCLKEKKVSISGTVNKEKIGNYEIIYTINQGKIKRSKKRIVRVVDKIKPEIIVQEKIVACPGKDDFPFEYSAKDNYDGDLTKEVVKKVEDGQVILQVKDSSGNKSILKKEIIYADEEAPSLVLNGASVLYIPQGGKYTENGYTATDNCAGDITQNVKISGSVDTNSVGKYTKIYSVSDGVNKTDVSRTIYVYAKNNEVSLGGNIIYLTYDDGPGAYTSQLLDILKKYDVKATFFVTGNGSDEMIQREYNEGHSIALHTFTHQYSSIYSSVDAYFNDLNLISNRVERITGQKTYLIRFPGGSSNTVSRFNRGIMTTLSKEVELRGYKYFDWNVSSGDTGTTNTEQIINNVIYNLKPGNNIVLQHDVKPASVNGVERIIQYGLSNGYTFQKLDMTSPTAHHGINN